MPERDGYREIFNHRGGAYHRAMADWPRARRLEFQHMLTAARVRAGMTVCDVPAGGGYLRDYLPTDVLYLAVEPSLPFARLCGPPGQVVLSEIEQLPFVGDSVDRFICLAALHHVTDCAGFFSETQRCLRPGGLLALADVVENSPVARFLNDFVDTHNPAGHRGRFLSTDTERQLHRAGLRVETAQRIAYPWTFPDRPAMARFCALLFGLESSEQTTLAGIDQYLTPRLTSHGASLTWELRFLTAGKLP